MGQALSHAGQFLLQLRVLFQQARNVGRIRTAFARAAVTASNVPCSWAA